ncbi:hypothetical protein T231_02120 [Tannerella sp. oral taxon BU063 isolate Cell 6/7/9]|uniref:Uncharacterized protein n=1 Tax=Tannerella sp. oral taxon BU063 isolate Cell 6/7/9 TaxID=1411021 RepID=W2CV38_9BACT|nr:hypothetical protein T231_02120 [Tannerella sp. oral taxon BU063 isolate Cell 6/7/9]
MIIFEGEKTPKIQVLFLCLLIKLLKLNLSCLNVIDHIFSFFIDIVSILMW